MTKPIKFAKEALNISVSDGERCVLPEFEGNESIRVAALVCGVRACFKTFFIGKFFRKKDGTVLFRETKWSPAKRKFIPFGIKFVPEQVFCWTPVQEIVSSLDAAWSRNQAKRIPQTEYTVGTEDGQTFTGTLEDDDCKEDDILFDFEERFEGCRLKAKTFRKKVLK